MNAIKYCPNCQSVHNIDDKSCQCGFEFVIKEVEDEIASTNTIVFSDPIPEFVWKLVGFFAPIAGFILYFLWKKKWPERAKILFKVSLGMTIFLVVSLAIIIFVMIGLATGDIV